MSAITLILKKLLSGILYVVNFVKRVFRLFYRQKESNIGELPRFVEPDSIVVNQNDSHYNYNQIPNPQQPQSSWNSWSDASFGVESKIEEYRRKQAEASSKAAKGPAEPDYFSDLRPEIKAAKRIELRSASPAQPRQNLFEFNENAVNIAEPTTELGDLDFDAAPTNNPTDDAWGDADLDVDQLDRVLEAQKQRERQERQKARLEEHQRRLVEKQQQRKPA